MPQSLSNNLIHTVFSTKHREPLIDKIIAPELFAYLGKTCRELKCPTIIVGGYRDHVHLLYNLHRTVHQSDLIRKIKVHSSKWIKTKGQAYENFYWQDGYASFSVSQRDYKRVERYIANQEAHHSKKTFEVEYIEHLEENEIEYDEQYIWD